LGEHWGWRDAGADVAWHLGGTLLNVAVRTATIRQTWAVANFVIAVGVAMLGWIWFFGWLVTKLF
jgi:hypothetical protein